MDDREKHGRPQERLKISILAFVLLAALECLPGAAWAWNANYRMCFPDVINTPDTYRQPPVINGVVAGDNGWTSAWRYAFNNGTYVHDAVIQGIKDADYLYLSIEVNHDQELNFEDVIVLAFDPTGLPADRRLLHIYPLTSGTVASPVLMEYCQGAPWTNATLPANTEAVAAATGGGTNWSWSIELKIPRADLGIPASGDFGLYVNIMPVFGPVDGPTGVATEYPWPLDTPLLTTDLFNTPDPGVWGTATVAAAACNGVFITPSDIRTEFTPPNLISLSTTTPTVFHATVHNTSIDGTGASIPVNGINATFKIANFGLSNMWRTVPATAPSANPTASTVISANSTTDLTTTWTLSAQELADYTAHQHQCMLVELNSTPSSPPWGTVFTNRSAWTNMNFGTASVIESAPEIDPRGWASHRRGGPVVLDLWVTNRIDQLNRGDVLDAEEGTLRGRSREHLFADAAHGSWDALPKLDRFPVEKNAHWQEFKEKLKKPSTQVSQLTYLVHGCAQTDRSVTIHKKKYSLCKRVGSYGYVLRHAGPGKANWKLDFEGGVVKRTSRNEGRFRISLNKPLNLSHRFEATDGPRSGREILLDWSADHRGTLIGGIAALAVAVYLLMRRKRRS